MQPVRKAVIPAAGLGTRFLPGDEELAQGDAAGRRQAGDPVRRRGSGAGRPHRHPDHHRSQQACDRRPLRPQLRARALPRRRGQARPAEGSAVRVGSRRHPLRAPARPARSRPRGVGRASSRRQRTVRRAARRRPHGRRRRAAALDARRARALRALGASRCRRSARGDLVVRLRRSRAGADADRRARSRSAASSRSRRATKRRRTSRSSAVTCSRPRSSTCSIASSRARWRAPAHRRDRAAARTTRRVFGYECTQGRYDVGQKLDFLRANIELALDRADLGPEFGAWLARPGAPRAASSDRA